MKDEHGIHIGIEVITGGGYKAVITIPTSKTEYQSWFITAPSQTLLLEVIRPFLRTYK